MQTLDYSSLLLALGVSATCLAITLMGSWLARRTETFLLTCTFGLVLVVAGIFVYSLYVGEPGLGIGLANFALLLSGFSVIWGAAYQFRTGRLPRGLVGLRMVAAMAIVIPPMLVGFDGLAFIFENLVIAILLLETAREYWRGRQEAPVPVMGITALYTLTSISFMICAAVLIWNGKRVLGAAPNNWAEDLSLAICIAGMTGIGALSLALHQWRLAARHRLDAITDPLTGLLNRRALFDLHGERPVDASTAVILFDVDRFKTVNDQYGHAVGDRVLKAFADVLSANCRTVDTAARLGGEEFALVLRGVLPGRAEIIAERVRSSFEAREMNCDGKVVKCTVSVGVVTASGQPLSFDAMLSGADNALYAAKRGGRNRIEVGSYLHAVASDASRSAS
ncbi:GGDEF domain-containing protein [Rhizobium sp. BK251]|uniref:GGDEF domain-containing protein n=1 Tax=Rhizobium sp. BK251 TaxID=2512125 RepID=UPI0010435406|nr:GGDEF domain-containing protein [Rhizobium sp. BK251]TCL72276.1 diguanylate cyclase (GGDEF)-like protein [Rhizobium sp. BK251]